MTKIRTAGVSAALMLGLAAPALAGPQFTFGPEDEGVLQLDYKGQIQLSVRDTGSGANNDQSTSNINFRRNRLALMGAWGDDFALYVQTEFADQTSFNALGLNTRVTSPQFSMLDAVFRFSPSDAVNVHVGKFKYSFSRENLEACENPLTADRSLFITAPLMGANPTRDMGVSVWGNLMGEKLQYRVDLMEGRKAAAGDDANPAAAKSSFRLGGRMHVSLLDPESGHGYKGTYLGSKKVLTFGVAVQHEPGALYTDWKARTGEKSYSAWTADAFFEYPMKDVGTVTLSGAVVKYKLGHAYLGANPDPASVGLNGEKNGWYAKGGYMLSSMPLQFFGRMEQWKFAQLGGVYNQQLDFAALGAHYYIRDQNLKFTVELNTTKFDKQPTVGQPAKDFQTFLAQLQVIF